MTSWWSGLDDRERLLISIAAILTALVVLWQFALVPTTNARSAARAYLDLGQH